MEFGISEKSPGYNPHKRLLSQIWDFSPVPTGFPPEVISSADFNPWLYIFIPPNAPCAATTLTTKSAL